MKGWARASLLGLAGGLLVTLVPLSGAHADDPVVRLGVRDHRFEPSELEVPAGVKFKLIVHNYDPSPEEFESVELRREKVVPGNDEVVVYIGPLKAGTYPFFGDFHQDTAQGRMTAKEPGAVPAVSK